MSKKIFPLLFSFIFVLLVFISFVSFVSASQISLRHDISLDFYIEDESYKGNLKIDITNLGSSKANDVYIIVNISNQIFKSNLINDIKLNEKKQFIFSLNETNNLLLNQKNLILIKTYYSDDNGYSFSSPNVIVFYEGNIIQFKDEINPSKISLYGTNNFYFKLNNSANHFLIFGPDELNIKNNLIKSNKNGEFNVRIGKGSSLKGSIYPLYVISYQNSFEDLSVSLVNIEIKEKEKKIIIFNILIILLILSIFLFFLNKIFYSKIIKKSFFKKYNKLFNKLNFIDLFIHKNIFDILIFLIIFVFLFLYFKPSLIFSSTITAGGDTASHYLTIEHYVKNFLPNFKFSGWDMGNYAGFPLLQFYFPLPFFIMALLSYFISIQVAFKLISILGIFLLPVFVYIMAKLMKLKFPIPILASISSLAFLFMESNSMWGANIPSTLAGEFSYSIAFALSFIFMGTLYKGINEKTKIKNKYLILNIILIFIIGLTHLYGLLFCAFISLFFITKKENLNYLLKLGITSFMLLGFWIIPMFMNLSYTTAYGDKWFITLNQVFPIIILPFIGLILINFFYIKNFMKNQKFQFISFSLFVSFILYLSAYYIGLVDIRFIPFIQMLLILFGVFSLSNINFESLFKILKFNKLLKFNKNICQIFLIIFVLLFFNFTVHHVENNVNYIDNWIKWNYEGFENKNHWNNFNEINNYLKNENTNSRVVFEHSSSNDVFGTTRAFEMLPYFANRSTLEGLYMQSSISAPFVFYIQALVSRQKSCPFPNYGCSRTNFSRAEQRLQMFNVGSLIIRSDYSKNLINENDFYVKVNSFGNYDIYNIYEKDYVYIPKFRPILVDSKNKQLTSYLWFINDSAIDVPLVFDKNILNDDTLIENDFIKEELNLNCNITSNIENEKISFYTDCLNQPHIISVSYYPKWKSLNKENIYYVSPSFMLIYPKTNYVEIIYKKNIFDYLGMFFTIIGFLLIFYLLFFDKINLVKNKKIYFIILSVIILILLYSFSYIYLSLNSDDSFVYEIALSTGSYTVCDHTHLLREDCLLAVALKNNDSNICTRSKNQNKCFYDYALNKEDKSFCDKIENNNNLRVKCRTLVS
jgi:hypothetical protein